LLTGRDLGLIFVVQLAAVALALLLVSTPFGLFLLAIVAVIGALAALLAVITRLGLRQPPG
jgi:hypothetical protein